MRGRSNAPVEDEAAASGGAAGLSAVAFLPLSILPAVLGVLPVADELEGVAVAVSDLVVRAWRSARGPPGVREERTGGTHRASLVAS